MDVLLEILQDLKPDVDFEAQTGLIDDRILDSFDIMSLVGSINEEFDVTIRPSDLIPQNFNSMEAMWKMIEALMED
ncbi:MAG: acyl carrier protein [Mogibacterium sp.]|nr:acyl carrier protein [Mogibacterium sp.]